MNPPAPSDASGPVLLFDGECGLCQRVVRLMLRLDRAGKLRFAPLQGPNAQAYLRAHGLPAKDFDTIVFVPNWAGCGHGDFLLRTDGVIAALRACGLIGAEIAALFVIWPPRWRDAVYRAVGHWRYRLFGPRRPRPLPRAEWAARFLA